MIDNVNNNITSTSSGFRQNRANSMRPSIVLSRLSLRPATPREGYHLFGEESWQRLLDEEGICKLREFEKKLRQNEGKLVDGELKFDEDDDDDMQEPDRDLVEGQVLPEDKLWPFPDEMLGKPIEEIDGNVKDKSFVVINTRFKSKYIYRFTATKSFFMFTPWNTFRKLVLLISTNQFFDYLIMLTILINCIFLALNNDYPISEYVFLAIYTLEMIIRTTARGFVVNPYTYLRDPYNSVDILIVLLSYVMIVVERVFSQNNVNISSLRTLRVLRALKTITILPSLRTIISALISSMRMLLEVIILSLFCMSVFALFALQIYQGTMRNKCVHNVAWNTMASANFTTVDSFYYDWVNNPVNWVTGGDRFLTCGNDTGAGNCTKTMPNTTCIGEIGPNPNNGYTNFDNFIWAMLSMFQLITLDFWENQYNLVIRASGSWNILFFVIVVFFGSFYLINLMLAVVSLTYQEEVTAQKDQAERENMRLRKAKNKSRKLNLKAKTKKNLATVTSSTTPGTTDPEGSTAVNDSNQDKVTPVKVISEVDETDNGNNGNNGESIESEDEGIEDDEGGKNEDQTPEILLGLHDPNCPCCLRSTVYYRKWLIFQSKLTEFIQDPFFEVFIFISIIINTVIMAIEHYPSSPQWDTLQNVSDIVFTVIFLIEAVLKILSMSAEYFKVGWNIFDFVVVIASIIALAVEEIDKLSVFRSFRLSISVVQMRVFKLAQSWKTMKVLITIIFSSITQMGNLSLVVIIVLYMFAVIGMQSFRNTYLPSLFDNDVPRWNFNDFWHSMILVFRVICGEWIEPTWDCAKANGSVCFLVFVPTLVIGNFVVLNLFLALLLNSFASDSLNKSSDEPDSSFTLVYRRLQKICPCHKRCQKTTEDEENNDEAVNVDGNGNSSAADEQKSKNRKKMTDLVVNLQLTKRKQNLESDSGVGSDKNTHTSGNVTPATTQTKISQISSDNKQDSRKSLLSISAQNSIDEAGRNNEVISKQPRESISKLNDTDENQKQPLPGSVSNSDTEASYDELGDKDNKMKERKNEEEEDDDEDEENKPMVMQNCFPDICFRCYQKGKICHKCYCVTCDVETSYGSWWFNFRNKTLLFTEHKGFEGFILALILFSSISLCFEDIYLDNNPTLKYALWILNYIFAAIFFVEMVLKIIGHGVRVYFTSFWTILDFVIVVIAAISFLSDIIGFNADVNAFRSLRIMRAFRPLRAISRWQGMKIVVNALIYAIPSIFHVLLVCMVFWLIFSITGVQFFKGRFFKCLNNSNGQRFLNTVVANKSVCEMLNQTWINSNVNFDNVTHGFLALFQIATFEGWMEIMVDAIDSTDIDKQPIKENNMGYYAYFVIFILVGSFFMLNLFIGVIIDNFNRLKKKYEGNYLDVFLTNSQRKYYNTLKKLSLRKPRKMIRRPKHACQGFFYDVAMSNKFEIAIVVMIFLNMVAMMIEHYKQPAAFTQVLEMINIMFTTIFTLEAVVKIIGLSWHYFRYIWNVFDFIIVILSIIDVSADIFRSFSQAGIVFDEALKNAFITPTLLRVVRVFRIGRVLRLIKAAKGIRQLLFALIISMPALFNIGTLLLLIVFIYAILGMTLFGNIKHTGVFDDLVNFENFERTILLLFRLTTAGGWNDVLEPMLIQPPNCNSTHVIREVGTVVEVFNGNCGIPWLATLYMTSFIFICYLIIINMYIAIILENFNQAHDQEEVGVTEDDFEMFYQVWERYDPHASQYIKFDYLSDFVAELDAPLGIAKPNVIALVSFDLPIVEEDKLHCLDILLALVRHVLGDVEDSMEFRELKKQMEAKYEEVFPTRVHTNVVTTTLKRKKEDIAAKALQRAWRRHKATRALKQFQSCDPDHHALDRPGSSGTNVVVKTPVSAPKKTVPAHFLTVPQMA